MDLDDFDLIYRDNRKPIKNKAKIENRLTEIVGKSNFSTKYKQTIK